MRQQLQVKEHDEKEYTITMRKLALAFYSYFCILQLASETNGEITPPWITPRGCYESTPGSRSTRLPDNSPTNCFKECANLTHIGIRADLCVCFENMPSTLRKPEFMCQSGQLILIYSKVIELPFNISQADYGYMYVSIQNFPSSIIFRASIDSSEYHGVICCRDYLWSCDFRMGAANNVNGEAAKRTCSLVSYFDFNLCQREDGDYWIGMFRETPDFISVESSTYASTILSSSTQQTSYVSDSISTTFSQTDTIIRSTIKLTPSPITETSSAYLVTNVTTSLPASPKDVDACIDGDKVCNNNGHCTNTHERFSCRCYEGYTGKNCETGIFPGPLFAGVAVAGAVPLTVIITLLIIWRRGALRLACSGLGQGSKENEITCSEPHLRTDPASNNTIPSPAADERIYDQPNSNMIDMNAYLEPTGTGIEIGNRDCHNHSREYEKLRLNENLGNSLYSSYNENQA